MKSLIYFSLFFIVSNIHAQLGFGFSYTHKEIEEYEGDYRNEYFIQYVFKKSPAEKAGLKAGDKIIKFHDSIVQFNNTLAFSNNLKDSPATVNIIISRNGVEKTFTITKADRSTYLNICLEGNCTNGTGTFIDANGTTYKGPFKNKKKEGRGESVGVNGDSYVGDWKNDKREGKGTYISKLDPNHIVSTGWSYTGDWKEDAMTGKGKMTYNGGFYEGDMLNNLKSGQGKLVTADKTVYEGNWNNDKLNGKGTMTQPNGDNLSGNFVSGKLEGEVTVYTKATNSTTTATYKYGIKI
ncbi:PDZ domain-containing protein [Flavobacterium sp. AS60]|uniref:PDZ domain-containing protein n=1 Tax=Flavobacterium anseongense TaxID=2910677 RepID=UPI001F3CB806|nr:PDZ domain-containing protein [Flavobacterium sp. AS60]MCF6129559.1 PDZ domain-containing protein [Flavobacterium sp. AS60]